METLVYHLHRHDLNAAFLDDIRSSIDAERIKIVIEPEHSAFEEKIHASVHDSVSYTFQDDEFERYSEQLLRGEEPNIEQYKRIRL